MAAEVRLWDKAEVPWINKGFGFVFYSEVIIYSKFMR